MTCRVYCAALQADWNTASDALASDAAALHPAVAQSDTDARLHDVQRLPVSGGHRRRRHRIFRLRLDSAAGRALRAWHVPLRPDSTAVAVFFISLIEALHVMNFTANNR